MFLRDLDKKAGLERSQISAVVLAEPNPAWI